MYRLLVILLLIPGIAIAGDPLPSWNNTKSKEALLEFVSQVTKPGGSSFVSPSERIAVFDNDGTLWPENPAPFQMHYAIDSLKQMVLKKPELATNPSVKAAIDGDIAALLADHYKGLFQVMALTHAGMTTEDFHAQVNHWMVNAKHPRFNRPYDECIYQPMREVLAYLRVHGFKTFIVSGGGADFMRVWTERVYGIPPEQVVGSRGQVNFEIRDGKAILIKTLDNLFVDDKAGKPVGIHHHIGRRPIVAFGNSDGDKEMLEYTTVGNPKPSFGMLIHHTDAEREYAYDAHPKSSGKLIEGLQLAPQRGWVVVDMKHDWNSVLSDQTVTAISILLELDSRMLDQFSEENKEIMKVFPGGFASPESQPPHIVLVQGFVRSSDLNQVYEAADRVLAGFDLLSLPFDAYQLNFAAQSGRVSILTKPILELSKLQRELWKALAPFTLNTGSSSAFVTTPDDLLIAASRIEEVTTFASKLGGEQFSPEIALGVVPIHQIEMKNTQIIRPFSFKASKAAVYQLGQAGPAKKLKSLR